MSLFADLDNAEGERHARKRRASASSSARERPKWLIRRSLHVEGAPSATQHRQPPRTTGLPGRFHLKSEAPKREHDTVAPPSPIRKTGSRVSPRECGKVGKDCHIDASSEGTTPVGAAVEAFAVSLTCQTRKTGQPPTLLRCPASTADHTSMDISTPFISRKRREDEMSRCPCHFPTIPVCCPSLQLLIPTLTGRMQHPASVPFISRNLQTNSRPFFLLVLALDGRM
jgi:hypothetical protein